MLAGHTSYKGFGHEKQDIIYAITYSRHADDRDTRPGYFDKS